MTARAIVRVSGLAALAVTAALMLAPSLAATPAPSAQGCPARLSARDEKAVRDLVEAYRTAWLRGDAAGVMATLVTDAVLLPARGAAPIVGAEAIRQYWWPPNAHTSTVTQLDITLENLGGDCHLAYSSGRDDVAWTTIEGGVAKMHGHPGTYLNVYVKQPDGTWRIARHMWDDGPSH